MIYFGRTMNDEWPQLDRILLQRAHGIEFYQAIVRVGS